MKKVCLILVAVIFIFNGCSSKLVGNNNMSNIQVKTPVTLANANLEKMGRDDYNIVLRLKNGEYYEDYNFGPDYGSNWVGDFELNIITETNEIIDSYPISEWDNFCIKDKFKILLNDYNNDGNYEFLLGQYGSSNFNCYRLYYITKDFKIGYYDKIGERTISEKDYSIELDLDENGNIKYSYYDNSTSKVVDKSIDINLLEISEK